MKSTNDNKKIHKGISIKLIALTALASLPALTALYMTNADLYINSSRSLPFGIYKSSSIADIKQLAKNDIALVCLKSEHAKIAFERGYIGYGKCSDGTAPVGKYIIATKGDKVELLHDGIHVNNKLVDYTTPAYFDSKGRSLVPYRLDRILKENEYILANRYYDSYDSRYFGPVRKDMIIGKLHSLVTV